MCDRTGRREERFNVRAAGADVAQVLMLYMFYPARARKHNCKCGLPPAAMRSGPSPDPQAALSLAVV